MDINVFWKIPSFKYMNPNKKYEVKFKVKATLRLTASQSVSLAVEPHLGLVTRYLLLFDSYGRVFRSALSDERTGLFLHMLLALARESLGTRDHIL
jgi:hypothetical protein